MNPKWRVFTFLILINLAWAAAAWNWSQRETWLWLTPIALSINFLLLTYDQVLSFSRLESCELSGQDPWGILKTLHRLSEKLRVPEPQLRLVAHPSAQIFAYARTKKSARVFITEGALQLLTPAELEAVLTHQLLSIDRSMTTLNYWVGALLDLVFRVGRGCERIFSFVLGWSPRMAVWLTAPVWWLLRLVLMSSHDYQKLDRRTAALIDRPEDLARALWKMESYAHTQPWRDSWVFAHMCMVCPLNGRLFRAQPSVKRRIKDLLGRYPL